MTIGAERPPYGAFQARFSPEGDHFTGKFFSVDVPSRRGPRQSGQSAAEAQDATITAKMAVFRMLFFRL
jgi:hypothetical protein